MAIQVMVLVFYAVSPELGPTDKSILLALADHSKEDGSDVRPGLARLEVKTGLARRTIQKRLKYLTGESGEISSPYLRITKAATNLLPNVYQINVDKLYSLQSPLSPIFRAGANRGESSTPQDFVGVNLETSGGESNDAQLALGVNLETSRGESSTPKPLLTSTLIKPSINQEGDNKKEITLSGILSELELKASEDAPRPHYRHLSGGLTVGITLDRNGRYKLELSRNLREPSPVEWATVLKHKGLSTDLKPEPLRLGDARILWAYYG